MSSPSSSWVYLFSKFTPEALLLETVAIAAIGGIYAVTWFVNRRRIQADTQVPAGVVKDYLNMLIVDAEYLRGQLFGLMDPAKVGPSHGVLTALGQAGAAPPVAISTISVDDPALAAKLAQLEAKMQEQTQALARIEAEKQRLEAELAAARAGGGGGDAGAAKQKIDLLEAKLAEYSVIEDDLANLKRLQQENAQLKAQLGGGGAAAAVTAAAAATPTAAPATPPPTAEAPAPEETAATPEPAAAQETAAPAETPAAAELPAAAALPASDMAAPDVDTTSNAEFENLVDQVEASIQETPAPAPAAAAEAPAAEAEATPAPAGAQANAEPAAAPSGGESVDDLLAAAGLETGSAPSTPAGAEGTMGNDADLVAEFEKMLNS